MPSGLKRDYGPKDIFYLCPHSEDGFTGLGIVDEAPEAIALCIAAEQHGAMLFGNGAKPSGILRTEQKVGGESLKLLKESWDAAHGGEKKFGTAAMDNGWDWKEVGMTNEHAQYTEVRSFQVAEAARLLGIPPILLFHSDTTSTFASAKELVLAFLKFSLDPWLTYWETAYNQDILNQEQNGRYYVEFVRQGIEKMDLGSRVDAYSKMIQSRIMNPNEARARENMNPYDGGDQFLNPNITPEGQDSGGEDEE
jgi:HK97 family phage portal protein